MDCSIPYKGIKTYKDAKKKLRKYNQQWKRIAGRRYVGSCSYLYKKLKPVSYEDFLIKYINDGNENASDETVDVKYRGRTVEELYALAEKYRSLCGNDKIGLETYLDDIIMHVIIETFDGHHSETIVKDMLLNSGFRVEESEDDDDALLNIDLKVYDGKSSKPRCFIQVKPCSTFRGDMNLSLVEDRRNFFDKQRKGNEKYPNVRYVYLIYGIVEDDKDNIRWYCKDDGNFKFTLDELCHCNGMTKFSTDNYELRQFNRF